MKWYSGCKRIFEQKLMDYFLNDLINDVVFLGNSHKIMESSAIEKDWYYTVLHTHQTIEIMIVLEGQCILEYKNQLIKLEQYDMAVTESGALHRERCIDFYTPYFNAYLSLKKDHVFLFTTSYNENDSFSYIPAAPKLVFKNPFLINMVENEVNCINCVSISKNDKLIFYNYLKTLYFYMYKNITSNTGNIKVDYESDLLFNIIEYIRNNSYKAIGSKEICSHFNMSESYLCNFVKKHLSMTPSCLINDIKVRKAMKLLLETNKKIMDIAYEVGYNDQYYFSKIFKSIIGKSPSEFREILTYINKGTDFNI